MPLYEFICPRDHKTEKIVPTDTNYISCPVEDCPEIATKIEFSVPGKFQWGKSGGWN